MPFPLKRTPPSSPEGRRALGQSDLVAVHEEHLRRHAIDHALDVFRLEAGVLDLDLARHPAGVTLAGLDVDLPADVQSRAVMSFWFGRSTFVSVVKITFAPSTTIAEGEAS